MAERKFIRADVLKYFTDHPGKIVYCDELCKEFNTIRANIQTLMNRIIKDGQAPGVRVIQGGNAWQFDPYSATHPVKEPETPKADNPKTEKAKAKQLFELLGSAKDGSLILESEDGSLYRASEL